MTTNTLIGVGLSLCGGTVQSFGFTMQKTGHNEVNKINDNINKDDHISVLRRWIWWVGIVTYTSGGAINAVALNFAAQSIIAPLSAVNLATNTVLSYFILKEALTKKDIIAILIIIIGSVIVVIFGPSGDDNVDITIDELRIYYQAIPYIVTVSILTTIAISVYIGAKFVERKNFKDEKNNEIVYGKNFLLFGWVYISCYFASNNTLFIKSSVTIIISSLASMEDLKSNATDFLSYIIIILWISCMLLMEYWRQKSLSHFGAMYVIPIFSVMSIILTALIGMVYFEEYTSFTVESAVLFGVGIIVTLIGVFVLSYDVGTLLSNLYDDIIKVAFINYQTIDYKHPKTVTVGGPSSEYFQQYFFKRPAVCYNVKYDPIVYNEKTALKSDKEADNLL